MCHLDSQFKMVLPFPRIWVGGLESFRGFFPSGYGSSCPAAGPCSSCRRAGLLCHMPPSSMQHHVAASSFHLVNSNELGQGALWKTEAPLGPYLPEWCQLVQKKAMNCKENWQLSKDNLPSDTSSGIWQDGSSFKLFCNCPKYVSTLVILAFSLW